MSKFLEGGVRCLYLDQFAISGICGVSPDRHWEEVAALVNAGVASGRLLCPSSLEQDIETVVLEDARARQLHIESQKIARGWRFYSEGEISAHYLINRIRGSEMSQEHFIYRAKEDAKGLVQEGVTRQLRERVAQFKQMCQSVSEPLNTIRAACRGGASADRSVLDVILDQKGGAYTAELGLRLCFLAKQGSFKIQPVQLGGFVIPFWADTLCEMLTQRFEMTREEAALGAILLREEGLDAIPSLSIRVSLEAIKGFRSAAESTNDNIDIMRIAGALPFADLMVIDSSKAQDIRELGLDKRYNTTIFSGKRKELAKLVETLTSINSAR